MTDNEYIKAAVELADGWRLTGRSSTFFYCPTRDGRPLAEIHQIHLDALAAQLVRQIDSKGIDAGIVFSSFGNVMVFDRKSKRAETFSDNPDRTMNTLKCIVDSGVLK